MSNGKTYDTPANRPNKRKRNSKDSDDRDKKKQANQSTMRFVEIYQQVYPHEKFIPQCNRHGKNNLIAYVMNITPEIKIDEGELPTEITIHDQTFRFDKFIFLAHKEIQVPRCDFVRGGDNYSATLQKVTGLEDIFDYGVFEWFNSYLFHNILRLETWNEPTTRSENGRTETGCRHFHIFPRFLNVENQNMLSASDFADFLINQKKTVLDLLTEIKNRTDFTRSRGKYSNEIQLEIKKEVVGQIVYYEPNKLAHRIDTIDFDISPCTHFVPDGDVKRISLLDFAEKKWKKKIVASQPLLVHRQMVARVQYLAHCYIQIPEIASVNYPADSPYVKQQPFIYLVPELCKLTGLRKDLCQLAILLPTVIEHIRYYTSLAHLEKIIEINFYKKSLLRKALTHPSYVEAFSVYSQRVRECYSRVGSLTNAPVTIYKPFRRAENVSEFLEIMDKTAVENPGFMLSKVSHNQRLEYLGDAVLEFIVTTKLFLMLPEHREGKLTLFRSSLVNNKTLCKLACGIHLDEYIQHYNFADMSKESKSRDGMLADAFEALLGTIYIDQGLSCVRAFYGKCVFSTPEDKDLFALWSSPIKDPLQLREPDESIRNHSAFAKLNEVEQLLGFKYNQPLLLLQAFTHPSLSNGLELLYVGNNQRLEFLGDAVIEFLVSQYLFTHFPEHQEGQLTLLRTALVNNTTLAEVSAVMELMKYLRYIPPAENKECDERSKKGMLADCFEALVGSLFLDKGLDAAAAFVRVTLLSRTQRVILEREWLDHKSKLKQVILCMNKKKSAKPVYKLLSTSGPPHLRVFTVGVYSQDQLLCEGKANTLREAEQDAAANALAKLDM